MDKTESKKNDAGYKQRRQEVQHRRRVEATRAAEARNKAASDVSDKKHEKPRQTEKEINAELERRQAEAKRDWEHADAKTKGKFSREFGQVEHKDWQAEIRAHEAARGRVEKRDYAIEYELPHPDGGKVRYDYVDFKEHRILDRKAQAVNETDLELVKEHKKQQQRHIEAYKARFGRTPTYEYSPYPSTKDLFKDDN